MIKGCYQIILLRLRYVSMIMPGPLTKYLSFFTLTVFCSCYSPRYVYSPSTQNIPLLGKKGDITAGGYFATGGGGSKAAYAGSVDYNLGMDVHIACALSGHLAIMINKYNRWERNNGANNFSVGDSSVIKYRRGLTELGAGYFTSRGTGAKNSFQVFGGMAFGNFQINDNNTGSSIHSARMHHSRITTVFVQPAIIAGQYKHFTASFSSKFSALFYHKIVTNYTATELNNYLLNNLSASPVFFWEPAMNYSLGFKKLKGIRIDLQSSFAILMNRRFVDCRPINIALGTVIGSDLFKKNTKRKRAAVSGNP